MSGYKIYIQKAGGEFIGDYAYSAWEGFDFRRSYPIYFFEDIKEVPKSKNVILIGYIQDTIKYFESIGIPVPHPLGIPDEIKEFTKRNTKVMTMGEFKKTTDLPIFVKPYSKLKEFMAGVIKKESSRRELFNDVPDESLVLTSDVLEMVSEYRGFVKRGKLVGFKHYIGDFRYYPDMKIVEDCIKTYKSAPSAYTMDFAVTDKGETVLIECNDGWSVGSYGLDGEIYVDFLLTRWVDIVK